MSQQSFSNTSLTQATSLQLHRPSGFTRTPVIFHLLLKNKLLLQVGPNTRILTHFLHNCRTNFLQILFPFSMGPPRCNFTVFYYNLLITPFCCGCYKKSPAVLSAHCFPFWFSSLTPLSLPLSSSLSYR